MLCLQLAADSWQSNSISERHIQLRPESEKCDMLDGKDVKCCGWLCDDAFMIVNGCVTLSGSPFDCLWFWEFRMIDESDLYQICNFRNMLLVPRNLSAIFRSRSKLLYRGTTGPCPDEMSSQRIYPLMRWTGPPLMRCPHPLMSGSPPLREGHHQALPTSRRWHYPLSR